tara:strand:- start:1146 stop:2225 length:1080 start_codon:yes stop_codon:yes gene_type:complete
MAVNTTTYSFLKPVVGGDVNLWGGYLNDNADKLDDLFDGTATVTGIDINGGSIDGTPIGATVRAAGAFSVLSATGLSTLAAVTASGLATLAAVTATTLNTSGLATLASVDINGGAIDGTTFGATNSIASAALTGTINYAIVPALPEANVVGLTAALASKLGATSNAASATKLATARTIALSGGVTGSVLFDGTANATITAVVVDDSHSHVTGNVDGLDTALAGKASTGTSVTAGNGLSGGGTLEASRTITMGTPSAITDDSSNSVTGSSHTHSLSSGSVGTLMGQRAVGTVGTFALLKYSATTISRSPGFSLAGSNLKYSNGQGETVVSPVPTGTWELHGHVKSGQSQDSDVSVWLRVI